MARPYTKRSKRWIPDPREPGWFVVLVVPAGRTPVVVGPFLEPEAEHVAETVGRLLRLSKRVTVLELRGERR